jgi:hypothetical protein
MAKKERWHESQRYIGFVELWVVYGWSWPEPLRWATTLRAFS